jgi:hypothetical protein
MYNATQQGQGAPNDPGQQQQQQNPGGGSDNVTDVDFEEVKDK